MTQEDGGHGLDDRFIADCMLGRLAKWLRVLGYDVAYDRRVTDDRLIARARREGRVLLTRDTRLVERRALRRDAVPWVLVESDRPERQLVQIVTQRRLEVSPRRLLTRCLRCNEPTVATSRQSVQARVPAYVLLTQEKFSKCPACDRVFWRATHVAAILGRLAGQFGQAAGPRMPD